MFRKIILFFGRIPASIKAAARKALRVTSYLKDLLNSEGAIVITRLIPGDIDDQLRKALLDILNALWPVLETAAEDRTVQKGRMVKAVLARVGAELVAAQDGKQHSMGQYSIWFEQVYQESKAAA